MDTASREIRSLPADEMANAATHGVGWAMSLVGAVPLIWAARSTGDWLFFFGCAVYAASLAAVYGASTLSHLIQEPRYRFYFRVLDQATIYLLIASSFTPIFLVYLGRDGNWWALLTAMWILAVAGCLSKLLFQHRIQNTSILACVALGWLPVIAMPAMFAVMPAAALALGVVGGVCYTIGTPFLAFSHRAWYFHSIWHLWVIAGSVCHYVMTLSYAVPAAGAH